MTWVRLDERFARHPKVVGAGPLGLAMQVAALCYCNEYLTDGFVAEAIVPGLLMVDKPGGIVEKLLEVGLWDKDDGGYRVHDFHDYQPTKAEVLALREVRKDAGSKGGKASGQAKAKQVLEQQLKQKGSKPSASGEAKTKPVSVPVAAAEKEQKQPQKEVQSEIAAALEAPRESDIRAACKQFAADMKVAEPMARQLNQKQFLRAVELTAERCRSGTVRNPAGLLMTFLNEAIAGTRSITTLPTWEERLLKEVRGYALDHHPWDVAEDLLRRKMLKLEVHPDDQERILADARRLFGEASAA